MTTPRTDPELASAPADPSLASATLDFPIRSYDCGPTGCATLSTLANYLQEAAGHHARVLGVSMERLMEDGLAWVLRRIRVEIERLPAKREVLSVETWPVRFDRLVAERHFVGRDEMAQTVVRAASEWVIVDMVKRRVAPVPDFIRQLRPQSNRLGCDLPKRGLGLLEKGLQKGEELHLPAQFEARRSSLDIVGHVNNAQYLCWIADALPPEWWQEWQPCGFEIQFLAECSFGECLEVTSWRLAHQGTAVRLLHRVSGAATHGGKRTLAVTEWRRRE